MAIAGFASSIAASCGVFSMVAGLYDTFGTLNIFKLVKKWVRPIVSGLLVNVMLSLLVQVKKQGIEFDIFIPTVFILAFTFVIDEILIKRYKAKNEVIAFASTIMSLIACNTILL